MAERYFTAAEVEALIPRLARIMERVMASHTEAGAARDRLQAEQQRIAGAGGAVLDRRAWRAEQEGMITAADYDKDAIRTNPLELTPRMHTEESMRRRRLPVFAPMPRDAA